MPPGCPPWLSHVVLGMVRADEMRRLSLEDALHVCRRGACAGAGPGAREGGARRRRVGAGPPRAPGRVSGCRDVVEARVRLPWNPKSRKNLRRENFSTNLKTENLPHDLRYKENKGLKASHSSAFVCESKTAVRMISGHDAITGWQCVDLSVRLRCRAAGVVMGRGCVRRGWPRCRAPSGGVLQ